MSINLLTEESKKYKYKVFESPCTKQVMGDNDDVHLIFNKRNGCTISWGKTLDDDVVCYPAPIIADIECTGYCTGPHGTGDTCQCCYKSNTPTSGGYMTFNEFKHIIDVFPKTLTQVALGMDACMVCNPDIWKIMEYCREKEIIPNVTLANVLNDDIADKLAKYCGAVAISVYDDLDISFNSIKKLTDRGMKQVNIHLLLAEEYYDRIKKVLNAVLTDDRLKKLNAVVCLSLKKKGRGVGFNRLSDEHFNEVVNFAKDNKISLGFDSCTAYRALKCLGSEYSESIIACESTLESSYINYKSEYFPCSFVEGEGEWKEGISLKDITSYEEFIDKVWHNEKTETFRSKLLGTCDKNSLGCRECPYFSV